MNVDAMWDSIKVRSELDAFAAAWRKRGATEEERRHRLAALARAMSAYLEPQAEPVTEEKLLQAAVLEELRRRERMKAQPADDDRPFTPSELRAEREADRRNAPPPLAEQMELVWTELVRPHVNSGQVRLPFNYKGRSVPMGGWQEFLERKGVYCKELETSVDVNSKTFTLTLM